MLSSKQQKIAFNCKKWELIELIGMRINRCIPFSGVSELKDVLFYMWLLYSVSVVFLNTRVRPTQKLFFLYFLIDFWYFFQFNSKIEIKLPSVV